MFTYKVTWYVSGASISATVNLDKESIADMALENLDGRLVDIIDEAKPYVEELDMYSSS